MSGVSSVTDLRLILAAESGLSPNARLYVATGSPLLFRRAGRAEQLHFDASWLYVPGSTSPRPDESALPAGSDVVLGHPIDLEDWLAYPVVAGGETVGQIVLPREEQPDLDQNQLVSLAGSLSPEIERDQRIRRPVSELFVQSLFQRDSSPQQFTKRLLSLLSLEWPGSCAGAYIEYQGLHHLLLATGEVGRYYRLSRQLTLEQGADFAAACGKSEPFLSAELLPDQATFLTTAPDLFYVHSGWKSERMPQYIVVVGPGDLGRRTARRLQEICALTASLRESQFHTAAELLDNYRSLSRSALGADEFNAAMSSVADNLGKQMHLSRIVISSFAENSVQPATQVFLTRPTGETAVLARESLDIPEGVVQKVRAGKSELIADLTSCGLSEDQSRRRYLDNVASEYCIPVETVRGTVGMAAFGSPVAGDYLMKAAPTLTAVAGLVSMWHAMKDQGISAGTASESTDGSTQEIGRRLNTIRRLTEGYLHGLSEAVSAAIGQAELLRDARLLDDPIIEAQRQSAAAETLCTVADRLDAHLSGLRHMSALTADPGDCLDCGIAVPALPALLAGLLRNIKDSKNIDLQIATEAESGLVVRAGDIYDCVLPLVMTLVEEAICSGTLGIKARGSEHTATISIGFRQRLLGGLELPRLLTELYPQCELLLQDSGIGQMIVGDRTIIFQPVEPEEFVLILDCGRCAPQEKACGKPAQGSK